MSADQLDAAAERLGTRLGTRVEREVSSAGFTTYRIGGRLGVLARVVTGDELEFAAEVVRDLDLELLVVGRGSNMLVADTGFEGVALLLEGEFDTLDLDAGAARVRAGGAVALPVLGRRSAAAGIAGLEFFVGIPGSVGGAVRMNAGGHGRETHEVLVAADVFDCGSGASRTSTREDLRFGYRRSAIGSGNVVTSALFAGWSDEPERCETRIAEIVRWRREHQPGGANAGSVFTNPPGDSAGRLIDAAGLKGLRVGGAVVSPKHANFIQAQEGATATDVYALVGEVARRVEEETGVRLHHELRLIGFHEGER